MFSLNSPVLAYIVSVILAYLIGSISFGLIIAKITKIGNIRAMGSGNTGATNMIRIGGIKLGLLIMLLDALKGASSIWIAKSYVLLNEVSVNFSTLASGVLFFCVLGHIFPIWHHFKGGRGVATIMGGVTAMHWPLGLIAIIMWIFPFSFWRVSSISSIFAATTIALGSLIALHGFAVVMLLLTTILVIAKHRDNIMRLIKGEEWSSIALKRLTHDEKGGESSSTSDNK